MRDVSCEANVYVWRIWLFTHSHARLQLAVTRGGVARHHTLVPQLVCAGMSTIGATLLLVALLVPKVAPQPSDLAQELLDAIADPSATTYTIPSGMCHGA